VVVEAKSLNGAQMRITIYTKFLDAALAEKALAALVDRGADIKDLTAMFPDGYQKLDVKKTSAEQAVSGITTTTGKDALVGAEKGAGIGLGLGAVAALASLLIPGFGLVTGGSALTMALLGVAGATLGGAVTGSVAGYLQDQGVPHRIALDTEAALKNGSAIIAVDCPTGKLDESAVTDILSKYHSESFGRADSVAVAHMAEVRVVPS
jgi:hypothetical protein